MEPNVPGKWTHSRVGIQAVDTPSMIQDPVPKDRKKGTQGMMPYITQDGSVPSLVNQTIFWLDPMTRGWYQKHPDMGYCRVELTQEEAKCLVLHDQQQNLACSLLFTASHPSPKEFLSPLTLIPNCLSLQHQLKVHCPNLPSWWSVQPPPQCVSIPSRPQRIPPLLLKKFLPLSVQYNQNCPILLPSKIPWTKQPLWWLRLPLGLPRSPP